MPKPLIERQASLLKPGARLADIRAAITETQAAIVALDGEEAQYRKLAVDVERPAEEVRAARDAVREIDLDRERHRAWIEAAEKKAATLVANENAVERRACYETIQDERDALAAELRDKWAPMLEAFADFLRRLEANTAHLPVVNSTRPRGAEWLIDAEMLARGYQENLCWRGGSPVKRLAKMSIPRIDGPGFLYQSPVLSVKGNAA